VQPRPAHRPHPARAPHSYRAPRRPARQPPPTLVSQPRHRPSDRALVAQHRRIARRVQMPAPQTRQVCHSPRAQAQQLRPDHPTRQTRPTAPRRAHHSGLTQTGQLRRIRLRHQARLIQYHAARPRLPARASQLRRQRRLHRGQVSQPHLIRRPISTTGEPLSLVRPPPARPQACQLHRPGQPRPGQVRRRLTPPQRHPRERGLWRPPRERPSLPRGIQRARPARPVS